MTIPTDLLYLASHEWCRVEGDEAVIGITDYAQDQLGDVVYLELPPVGTIVEGPTKPFGAIESVKAASDLYSPVRGEVVAVHEELMQAVEQVNQDPYGEGWMIRVRIADPSDLGGLLDHQAYAELLASEA